jgi:hypothetical protein
MTSTLSSPVRSSRLIASVLTCLALAGCALAQRRTQSSSNDRVASVNHASAQCSTGERQPRSPTWQVGLVNYHTVVYAPNTQYALAAFETSEHSESVTGATVWLCSHQLGAITFATRRAFRRWTREGSPYLESGPVDMSVPLTHFGFLPAGTPLTYRQISRWPKSDRGIISAIIRHIATTSTARGRNRRAYNQLLLRSYAFLLGAAPLSTFARQAIIHEMQVSDRMRCSAPNPRTRRNLHFCARSNAQEYELTASPNTLRAVLLTDRLVKTSPLYPEIKAGRAVEAIHFAKTGIH